MSEVNEPGLAETTATDPGLISQAIAAYAQVATAQAAAPQYVQGAVASAVPLSMGNQQASDSTGMSTTAKMVLVGSVLLLIGAVAVRLR